ncbi:CDP-archaeol synthase [Candidatus Saccharibacteria bacterium]|nr:CDP-archaeol synthase [Candidatus Saccharibacteria bacterium]
MFSDIMFALWFFLPAGIANASPVFANKIPILNKFKTPVDFGKKYKGQRILGNNKTWRGILFGAFAGGITGLITYFIYPESITYVSLSMFSPALDMFVVGASLGTGALVGDSIESFFKRRVGVKPGESWFPFDQTDYIIGGLIFATPFVTLTLRTNLLIFVTWFCAHLFWSYIGFLLKLKDKPI